MFEIFKSGKEKRKVINNSTISDKKGKFFSTKTYGNDRGLSCCFRQWRATHSHCSLLHGYSIGFKLVFECDSLDERNWVMDFGGLKELKQFLEDSFDHTIVVAEDDPKRKEFLDLEKKGLAKITWMKDVGSEKFAQAVFDKMEEILRRDKLAGTALNPTVRVKSVECFEHGANSAGFEGYSA